MTRLERQVVLLTSGAHGLVHAQELTYAAVLGFVAAEFGSGLFLLGLLANISALALGATAIPAGVLTDRFGSKRVVIGSFLGSAFFCALIWRADTELLLVLGLVGLGIVNGVYHPAALSLISRTVVVHVKGFAFHGMGGNIGIAVPPLLAVAIASLWSWHEVYLLWAAVSLLFAALVTLSPIPHGDAASQLLGKAAVSGGGDLRAALVPLGILYSTYILSGLIYRGFLTFLPTYMDERVVINLFGIDPVAMARSSTSIALTFGVLGQYIGGAIATKYRLEPLALVLTSIVVPVLGLMGVSGNFPLVLLAACFMLFNFMGQPVFNGLVTYYTPVQLRGRSFGISFFCTFALGSFGAGIAGFLAENLGLEWVFPGLGGIALVLTLLVGYLCIESASRKPQAALRGD